MTLCCDNENYRIWFSCIRVAWMEPNILKSIKHNIKSTKIDPDDALYITGGGSIVWQSCDFRLAAKYQMSCLNDNVWESSDVASAASMSYVMFIELSGVVSLILKAWDILKVLTNWGFENWEQIERLSVCPLACLPFAQNSTADLRRLILLSSPRSGRR